MGRSSTPNGSRSVPATQKRGKRIFLSHRRADAPIADVLRRNLGLWGFDDDVFQYSAPGHGATLGASLTDELRSALRDAKLVILVYTLIDNDWTFCMWECGLATHPTKQDTRTIVFQCNPNEAPRVFAGQTLVNLDEPGIKNFTSQFFRQENFLPGEPAIKVGISEETLGAHSTRLYSELQQVIPPGVLEERYRWDFLVLELLSSEVAAARASRGFDSLARACRVTDHFGEALKHFGYANLERNLRLADLIDRWKAHVPDCGEEELGWVAALGEEMFRAIDNRPSSPVWKELTSVNVPDLRFYPVVNHVRIHPDGSMEFRVYFYRSMTREGVNPKLVV